MRPIPDFLRSSQTKSNYPAQSLVPFFGSETFTATSPLRSNPLPSKTHLWTFLAVKWPELTQCWRGERGWLPVEADALLFLCFTPTIQFTMFWKKRSQDVEGKAIVWNPEGHAVLKPHWRLHLQYCVRPEVVLKSTEWPQSIWTLTLLKAQYKCLSFFFFLKIARFCMNHILWHIKRNRHLIFSWDQVGLSQNSYYHNCKQSLNSIFR